MPTEETDTRNEEAKGDEVNGDMEATQLLNRKDSKRTKEETAQNEGEYWVNPDVPPKERVSKLSFAPHMQNEMNNQLKKAATAKQESVEESDPSSTQKADQYWVNPDVPPKQRVSNISFAPHMQAEMNTHLKTGGNTTEPAEEADSSEEFSSSAQKEDQHWVNKDLPPKEQTSTSHISCAPTLQNFMRAQLKEDAAQKDTSKKSGQANTGARPGAYQVTHQMNESTIQNGGHHADGEASSNLMPAPNPANPQNEVDMTEGNGNLVVQTSVIHKPQHPNHHVENLNDLKVGSGRKSAGQRAAMAALNDSFSSPRQENEISVAKRAAMAAFNDSFSSPNEEAQPPVVQTQAEPQPSQPGAFSAEAGVGTRLTTVRHSLVGVQPQLSASVNNSAGDPEEQLNLQAVDLLGLAEALPVHEEDISVAGTDITPVDMNAALARKSLNQKKNQNIFFCFFVTLISIILATVLGVMLGNKSSSPAATESTKLPSVAPSEMPSSSPTAALDVFMAKLPNHTLESLRNPDSPQSQALGWLQGHQGLANLEEFQKTQLFAMATIYYAWDGPNWPHGLNEDWLDDTRSECLWYSSSYYTERKVGEIMNFYLDGGFTGNQNNQTCNDNGEIEVLSLEMFLENGLRAQNVTFPREIELLSGLTLLSLRGLGLDVSFHDEIWPAVSNLNHLAVLDLRGNALPSGPGGIAGAVPSEIGTLTSLVYLDVHGNQLTGSLPTEFGLLDLGGLELGGNTFTGDLPSQLGQLSRLTSLEIGGLGFSGVLPSEIFLLTDLDSLDIAANLFSGPIPTEIGELSALRLLWAGRNLLTGTLPSEVGAMTQLTALQFSWCPLTGSLPSEFGLLHNLTTFYTGTIGLTGTIPTEFGMMSSVDQLGLQRNNFSGPIPSELGLLDDQLRMLYLYENALSGSIPSELGSLKEIKRFQLHNNNLSGSMPTELGLIGAGEVLLNNNNLSGELPPVWANLEFNSTQSPDLSLQVLEQKDFWFVPPNLATLDVRENPLLTGTVPHDLCLMKTSACHYYQWYWFQLDKCDGESFCWRLDPCVFQFNCTDLLCGCTCPCQNSTDAA